MIWFILTILCFVIGLPQKAWAWGPAAHLEYANLALEVLPLLPLAVKKLLSKHKDHYLYGAVAADITLGKDLRGYLYNCHNWKVALSLFYDKAKEDSQKAFMLGYLSHLAADTVAHNFFVPYKLVRSWNTTFLKHVYWEIRFDLSVPEKYWKLMEKFMRDDFSDDDKLLESHLKRTFFSFKTNKKIFNSLFFIQQLDQYKKVVASAAANSTWVIKKEDIFQYKTLATNAVIDFLTHMEKSYCLRADPTGKQCMSFARNTIVSLRAKNKEKALTEKEETRLLQSAKLTLKNGIYHPIDPHTIDEAEIIHPS